MTFWDIIAQSRANLDSAGGEGDMEAQVERLQELLRALEPRAVLEFDRAFDEHFRRAYTWDLWGAAYIIGQGCSDDGFMDFRSWLISMGREVYEAALRNPESLADIAEDAESVFFEEFQYVAEEVYLEQTGKEMPPADSLPGEPSGTSWSEEDSELQKRFPVLWSRFGEVD